MAASGGTCTAQESIPGIAETVLDHWSTPSHSLVYGTRVPTNVVLPGDECPALTGSGVLELATWDYRYVDTPGWFDFRSLGHRP